MFNWTQYIELAEELATDRRESALRSAVSRAYYGAFGLATNWILENDPSASLPADGRKHEFVWRYFADRKDRVSVRIANEGTKLRAKRNDADYRRGLIGVVDQEALLAVRYARNIAQLLASHR